MINRIIDYCARHQFLVFTVVAVAVVMGWYSMRRMPLDAIPDLSDTQVIVSSRWDRSPDIIEDQVTYPVITAMLGAPKVKAIRGFSDFGYSFIYIIFEDGTDIYWARSRTLEYLSKIIPRLPDEVKVELGPDATALGWIFQYALVDTSSKHSLADLRSFQDWYLRYYLQSVPGVSEVASVGGFVRQYQVNVQPSALLAYNIPLERVVEAIRRGNNDVGGRLVEFSGREYMVRGRGYVRSVEDIESIVIGTNPETGTPVLVWNIATVSLGPDIRRGVAELDGMGETAGGIVIMRHGQNALQVIKRLKEKIEEVKPALPQGVKVVTTYDRSELIERSIDTLKHTLIEELLIVSLIVLIFLLHLPSAIIPILTLPIAAIISFIPLYGFKITANIMSLGGIAIAIGAMVDAAIVVVEQTHKKLEHWEQEGRKGEYREVIISAVKEVGGPSFYSLLVIAISFLPIFALEAQEGRLFKPLAFTKNFAMIIAAVLAITLDPALRLFLTRPKEFSFRPSWIRKAVNAVVVGKIRSEEKHPISRALTRLYQPALEFVLKYRKSTILAAVLIVAVTIPFYFKLGSEFMPPLNEGVILSMPTTLPGISVTETTQLLQVQDKILKSFPEVERVFGKAGRAETSTDPAPFSMMETTVVLRSEREWRKKERWYSRLPGFLHAPLRRIWRDRISWEELVAEFDTALKFPGVSNAWTMPIKARIDMLTTGIRTPVGIKIFGADLKVIESLGSRIEGILKDVPGTSSIFAEKTAGGYFLDFELKRDELARYGLSVDDAQMIIMSAIGGEAITTTVEGRERYTINLRYAREFRDSVDALGRVLVPTMSGAQIPLRQIADIRLVQGPAMIKNENGMIAGYVYIDLAGRDIGSYVRDAKKAVREKLELPAGYSLSWSGQYEYMARVKERLFIVVPITLFIIFLLLYANTGSFSKVMIVLLAVPFSAVGAIWLLYALDYQISIGVWVGLIALLGVDAETGVFMLLYLDLAYKEKKSEGRMKTASDLKEAIRYGAAKRLRPKVMTVATDFIGLLPIMWSLGAGSDMMKRIAAPLIGGIFTSFLMELLVYPAVYYLWKWHAEVKRIERKLPEDNPVVPRAEKY
jgi:Cu(I)/Ag(I) efflux system membrane protein CusA/SilA